MPTYCVAIVLSTGLVCNKPVSTINDQVHERCQIHLNSLERNGPHATELKELEAKYTKHRKDFIAVNRGLITTHERTRFLQEHKNNYDNERNNMLLRHAEYIREHGDPDALARARRAERDARLRDQRNIGARVERDVIRNYAIINGMIHQPAIERYLNDDQFYDQVNQIFYRERQPFPRHDPYLENLNNVRGNRVNDINNNIRDFANDRQNVHTTVAINQTQTIVSKLLEIPVPEDYRWNKEETSKTPGEIIAACRLSLASTANMMNRYSSLDDTYGIQEGIYGKVLDAVWQFIQTSDDKIVLQKTLKIELQDSIGMCPEGNLTRLANVMAGYVDYITIPRSPAEIMGDLMQDIVNIEDPIERASAITKAFVESKLPAEKWNDWINVAFEEIPIIIRDNAVIVA